MVLDLFLQQYVKALPKSVRMAYESDTNVVLKQQSTWPAALKPVTRTYTGDVVREVIRKRPAGVMCGVIRGPFFLWVLPDDTSRPLGATL